MIAMTSMGVDTTVADMDTRAVSTTIQATATEADTETAIAEDMPVGVTSMGNANFMAADTTVAADSTGPAVFGERAAKSRDRS